MDTTTNAFDIVVCIATLQDADSELAAVGSDNHDIVYTDSEKCPSG